MPPLTKGERKKRRILAAIVKLSSGRDRPPTVDEIMRETGIRSFDVITRHMKELRRDGVLANRRNGS